MLWLMEIIAYTFYMYGFVLFSIYFKPSLITIVFFFIYCFFTTYYIISGCPIQFITNFISKSLFTFLYSFFCLSSFYLIHTTWRKYKNNKLYQLILIGFPLYYYITVKIVQKQFECHNFHIILFPLRIFISTTNSIINKITT